MDAPAIVVPLFNDYGKVLKNQILKPCGITPAKLTSLATVESSSQEKRESLLKKISQIASNI